MPRNLHLSPQNFATPAMSSNQATGRHATHSYSQKNLLLGSQAKSIKSHGRIRMQIREDTAASPRPSLDRAPFAKGEQMKGRALLTQSRTTVFRPAGASHRSCPNCLQSFGSFEPDPLPIKNQQSSVINRQSIHICSLITQLARQSIAATGHFYSFPRMASPLSTTNGLK
jgi:hypothetical protein